MIGEGGAHGAVGPVPDQDRTSESPYQLQTEAMVPMVIPCRSGRHVSKLVSDSVEKVRKGVSDTAGSCSVPSLAG